jgi:hypothetical protein
MFARSDQRKQVASYPEMLGITLMNYPTPLIFAVICAAVIYGLAFLAASG